MGCYRVSKCTKKAVCCQYNPLQSGQVPKIHKNGFRSLLCYYPSWRSSPSPQSAACVSLPLMFHFFQTLTFLDPSLLGCTPHFLPCCFIQSNLIISVKKQGNDMCLHVMTEKLFLEWTTLCAWHVDIAFLIPLSQHSIWNTSPAHGCQGQDIYHLVGSS